MLGGATDGGVYGSNTMQTGKADMTSRHLTNEAAPDESARRPNVGAVAHLGRRLTSTSRLRALLHLAPRRHSRPYHGADDRAVARFWELLQLEVERARRHERQFALTRLTFARPVDEAAIETALADLRYCDASAVVDGHPMILWSETHCDGARRALSRLAERFPALAGVGASTVVFPDDGYTPTALMELLHDREPSILTSSAMRWAAEPSVEYAVGLDRPAPFDHAPAPSRRSGSPERLTG